MTVGEHTFTKMGRQRPATYATISVPTVVRAFTKAGILTEPNCSSDIESDNDDFDKTEPGKLNAVLGQLFISDTAELLFLIVLVLHSFEIDYIVIAPAFDLRNYNLTRLGNIVNTNINV